MTPEQFWRSTPRITNLFVLGYLRRRAWAAYHYNAPQNFKNVTMDHLMGRKPKGEAMSPEAMLSIVRRLKKSMQRKWGKPDGE